MLGYAPKTMLTSSWQVAVDWGGTMSLHPCCTGVGSGVSSGSGGWLPVDEAPLLGEGGGGLALGEGGGGLAIGEGGGRLTTGEGGGGLATGLGGGGLTTGEGGGGLATGLGAASPTDCSADSMVAVLC